jgi:hypothetical protein
MNLKEAKIMLEKINRLYDSMVLDSKIDPYEQELMLSYIKKLYVAFSSNGEQMTIQNQTRISESPAPFDQNPEPKIIKRVVADPPKVVVTPPPAFEPEEITSPVIEEEVKPMPKPQAKPSPIPAPTPAPAPKPTPTPPAAPVVMDAEVVELFEDTEGKELSDRLAALPIHDLNKAMGLNEKILTVNELFNKDQQAFTTAMQAMNTLANFEEAKKHLIECAQKFGWTNPDKMKKAQVFIKMVRRRYK